MRPILQRTPAAPDFSRSGALALQPGVDTSANAPDRAESWDASWRQGNIPSASATATAWWAASEEGSTLLQRLALAHALVGVCVALALGWQVWSASGQALTLTPLIGLILSVGGGLALLLPRLDHPIAPVAARLALVAVDLCATGGILWLRGGQDWALLVLLPPIALAVAFFAEPGGALATLLAALMIVAANYSRNTPPSGWIPSLLVFLGVAALLVAFLGIYSARITETSASLRWLLADARAANQDLYADRQRALIELRAAEQARDSLLRERARTGELATLLATLVQQAAQGDPSAAQALQTLHPGACGPLAEMASTLMRLSRAPAGSWQIAAIETPVRAQGQALEALDTMARSLCVDANELVVAAQGLEPGLSLIGSGEYSRSLWQLEERLRIQSAHLALLGTQLADIRTTQENLETMLARAAAGAKTPPIFAMSDIRPINQHSGPQVTFGSSAIRRAAEVRQAQQAQPPQLSQHRANGTGRAIRPGNWQSQESLAYNRGV